MKTFLITPDNRSLERVEIDGLDDIKTLIGFDTLESDAVNEAGDRIYFDEECFLRGTAGRFQLDAIVPISGKAIIVGTADDGATLRDMVTNIDELRSRIKYQ